MTPESVKNIVDRIESALGRGAYTVALMELGSLVESTASGAVAMDELRSINNNYSLLKQYALDGADDPLRASLLDDVVVSIRRLAQVVAREVKAAEIPTLYFNTLRYERRQKGDSIASLIERYGSGVSGSGLLELGLKLKGLNDSQMSRKDLEALEKRIFDRVWVTFPLGRNDVRAIGDALSSNLLSDGFKRLLIGAILLGGLEYFDENRVLLLADAYAGLDTPLDVYALCSLFLLLRTNVSRKLSKSLNNRLAALSDLDGWEADVRTVCLQFLRAHDAERITRDMTERIIPKMMKMKPDIEKLKEMDAAVEGYDDFNPEWEDMLKKSGIEKELKRLNDMQTEGADVMMSTFGHLKNFAFFNTVANWFRAFDPDYSELKEVQGLQTGGMADIIRLAPTLCDSDKYSLAFSFSNIPADARRMMAEQMKSQNIDMAEVASHSADISDRDVCANLFVQDLNRFFKFFRRKGEFKSPFGRNVNIFEIPLVAQTITDSSLLKLVSEFYFKRGYYESADEVLGVLLSKDESGEPDVYQKAAYCKYRLGDFRGAVNLYSMAELIDSNNKWTMQQKAGCHKALGEFDKALPYYKRLYDAKPDSIELLLNLAYCQVQTGNVREALNNYFKAEFTCPSQVHVMRALAWCLFLSGDYKRADEYYNRVLVDPAASASDYLNHGHVLMSLRKYRDAVAAYSESLEKAKRDIGWFGEQLENDRRFLDKAGVDPIVLRLVADEVESMLWH